MDRMDRNSVINLRLLRRRKISSDMEVEFNPDGKTPVSRCGAEQCFTNSAEITSNYGVMNDWMNYLTYAIMRVLASPLPERPHLMPDRA